jgi:hypothetical protein
MNLLLIILKYAGTAISGAAGIWGTLSETRDKKTKKLTVWGKWALGLAIAGFVVALGSQITEQILDKKEQAEREQKHSDELSYLTNQLDSARQAQTGQQTLFNTVEAIAVFELPASDPQVQSFISSLEDLKKQSTTSTGMTKWPSGISDCGRNAISMLPKYPYPDAQLVHFLSNNQAFFGKCGRLTLVAVKIDKATQGGMKKALNANLLDADWLATVDNNTNRSYGLYFNFKSHRLYVAAPTFRCDSQNWVSKGRISGISDLSQATLTLSLVSPPIQGLNVVECDMSFGNFPCTLTNFFSGSNKTLINFSATLPNADAILGLKKWGYNLFLNN